MDYAAIDADSNQISDSFSGNFYFFLIKLIFLNLQN